MAHKKRAKIRAFRDFSDAADLFSSLLFQIEDTMDTCPPKIMNQLNAFLAELNETSRKEGTSRR